VTGTRNQCIGEARPEALELTNPFINTLFQLAEIFAQSVRSGTRFSGNFASSALTSSSVRPIR